MFFEPGKTAHGLPYDPFKACVVPRPIGWISTLSPTGKCNLAPYSQFNNLTFDPPYVMFAANTDPNGDRKDTTRNVENTGVFCWNLATWDLRESVNISAEWTEYGVDEFERAGLAKGWSKILRIRKKKRGEDDKVEHVEDDGDFFKIPFVASSPVRFECEYFTTLRLPGNPPMGTVDIVIGRVVGIHIDDSVLTDGKLDIKKTQPIARCGYYEYTVVKDTFEMKIPGHNKAVSGGLEGNSSVNRGIIDGRKGEVMKGVRSYEDKYSEECLEA